MTVLYELTIEAIRDMDDIWLFIARDSPKAADRVESAILEACVKGFLNFLCSGNPEWT